MKKNLPLIDVTKYMERLLTPTISTGHCFSAEFNAFIFYLTDNDGKWGGKIKIKITRPIMFKDVFNLKFYYSKTYTTDFRKKPDEIIKFKLDGEYNVKILNTSQNNTTINNSIIKLYKNSDIKLK